MYSPLESEEWETDWNRSIQEVNKENVDIYTSAQLQVYNAWQYKQSVFTKDVQKRHISSFFSEINFFGNVGHLLFWFFSSTFELATWLPVDPWGPKIVAFLQAGEKKER